MLASSTHCIMIGNVGVRLRVEPEATNAQDAPPPERAFVTGQREIGRLPNRQNVCVPPLAYRQEAS